MSHTSSALEFSPATPKKRERGERKKKREERERLMFLLLIARENPSRIKQVSKMDYGFIFCTFIARSLCCIFFPPFGKCTEHLF